MTKAEKRETWKSRIAEFKASGQSATSWCALQNLNIHQFYYWIRKFKSEDEPTTEQTRWLSVEIGELKTNKPKNALPVRVGKATIEVSPGFDPVLLSDVVRTLSAL